MERVNSAPRWVLAVVAIVSLSVLVFFGWQTLSGQPPEVGPAKRVTPGMYDLRAEAAKMRDSKGTGTAQNDLPR